MTDGRTYWHYFSVCEQPYPCPDHPDAPWQTTDGGRVFDGEEV